MLNNAGKKFLSLLIALDLSWASVCPARAAEPVSLPQPGTMVNLSVLSHPPVLTGVKIYPDDPFRFDFILDQGDPARSAPAGYDIRTEANALIRYFLASLTVPEKDLWVNLSPYEKDRIIPEEFGLTEMGRDLLAQDYILKQLTASVMYPGSESGKRFWSEVYRRAYEAYGTTDIPVDTFNKVWIVPDKAAVYERYNAAGTSEAGPGSDGEGAATGRSAAAYVVEARLKVMLESDYLAQEKSGAAKAGLEQEDAARELAKDVIREVIIPVLENEVNSGDNFARLRQVYHSLILAAWYKRKIKDSLFSAVYVDQKKVTGVRINDPQMAERIWARYVEAFKKGAYNYIQEERDRYTHELIPRKYFSGGLSMTVDLAVTDDLQRAATPAAPVVIESRFEPSAVPWDQAAAGTGVTAENADDAMRGARDKQVLDLLRAAYQEMRSGALSSGEIDLTGWMSDYSLQRGLLPKAFVLPSGSSLGVTQHLYLGGDLTRLTVRVTRNASGGIEWVFTGYKGKDVSVNIGTSTWGLNEAGSALVLLKATVEPVLESLKNAYAGLQPGQSLRLDLTGWLGESALGKGRIQKAFPLPSGQNWGQTEYLRLGDNLSRVEVEFRRTPAGEMEWAFSGYKTGEKGEVFTGSSVWRLNEAGDGLAFSRKISVPVVESIKEAYAGLQPGQSLQLDLTEWLGESALGKGRIHKAFPLPSGKSWGEAEYLRLGDGLSRVELDLRRTAAGEMEWAFSGYKAGEKGEVFSGGSVWKLNETGDGLAFTRKISVPVVESIKNAYANLQPGQSLRVDLTEWLGESALGKGRIQKAFPLPSGQSWGDTAYLRLGSQLTRVEVEIRRTAAGGWDWVFSGYQGEAGPQVSTWRWDETARVPQVDAAMTPTGGIDLNPVDNKLDVQGSREAVRFNIDPEQLEKYRSTPGFIPVILNVRSLNDLPSFLGAK